MNAYSYPKGIYKAIQAYEREVRDILIQALNLNYGRCTATH